MLWEIMMKCSLKSKGHARALRNGSHSATMLLSVMLHTARFMDCTEKKRLQLGLHIHFSSERAILKREGLQAKQLPDQSPASWSVSHLLISHTPLDESNVTWSATNYLLIPCFLISPMFAYVILVTWVVQFYLISPTLPVTHCYSFVTFPGTNWYA